MTPSFQRWLVIQASKHSKTLLPRRGSVGFALTVGELFGEDPKPEPGWGVSSVNFEIKALLERAEIS